MKNERSTCTCRNAATHVRESYTAELSWIWFLFRGAIQLSVSVVGLHGTCHFEDPQLERHLHEGVGADLKSLYSIRAVARKLQDVHLDTSSATYPRGSEKKRGGRERGTERVRPIGLTAVFCQLFVPVIVIPHYNHHHHPSILNARFHLNKNNNNLFGEREIASSPSQAAPTRTQQDNTNTIDDDDDCCQQIAPPPPLRPISDRIDHYHCHRTRWLLSGALPVSLLLSLSHTQVHTSCSSTSWSNATSAVAIARREAGDKARSSGRGGVTGTGAQPIGEASPSAAPETADVAENSMVFFIMKSARRRVWTKTKGRRKMVCSLAMPPCAGIES